MNLKNIKVYYGKADKKDDKSAKLDTKSAKPDQTIPDEKPDSADQTKPEVKPAELEEAMKLLEIKDDLS